MRDKNPEKKKTTTRQGDHKGPSHSSVGVVSHASRAPPAAKATIMSTRAKPKSRWRLSFLLILLLGSLAAARRPEPDTQAPGPAVLQDIPCERQHAGNRGERH